MIPRRIIGIDPGTSNFAYSVVEGCDQPDFTELFLSRQRLLNFDYFKPDYDTMMVFVSDFKDECASFGLCDSDIVCIERYEFRGWKTGKKIEPVNLMIGLIILSVPCPVKLFTPVLWKNWFRKRPRVERGESEHERDSLNLALYGWTILHDKQVSTLEF